MKGINVRDISLDIIRSFAIICVVLNHSVESYFNLEEHDVAASVNTMDQSG